MFQVVFQYGLSFFSLRKTCVQIGFENDFFVWLHPSSAVLEFLVPLGVFPLVIYLFGTFGSTRLFYKVQLRTACIFENVFIVCKLFPIGQKLPYPSIQERISIFLGTFKVKSRTCTKFSLQTFLFSLRNDCYRSYLIVYLERF